MPRERISAVIITKNEEGNIERCLKSLKWVDEIVVIDGESDDRTVELAKAYGAKVITHKFEGDFGLERNLGNQHATGDWVLALDADEVMPKETADAIKKMLQKGTDADAIGEAAATPAAAPAAAAPVADPQTPDEVKDLVWKALRNVYDPEIPVNVVELGLVYNNDVAVLPEGGYKVDIKMTLTAPGCGMGDVLKADAERLVKAVPKVQAVNVTMVVEPAWNISMISEAARLELGL